jgi:hypothetical protein
MLLFLFITTLLSFGLSATNCLLFYLSWLVSVLWILTSFANFGITLETERIFYIPNEYLLVASPKGFTVRLFSSYLYGLSALLTVGSVGR